MKVAHQEIVKKGLPSEDFILLDKENLEPRTGTILNEEIVNKLESDKIKFGSSDILISKIDPFLGHIILNDKSNRI